MEQPQPLKREDIQKTSALENVGKAVVFATALTSAGAMTSTPAEAAPTLTQYEQRESFNKEPEAEAFLKRIASMDVGIDDTRGKKVLYMKVSEQFNIFALSLKQRQPHFSRGGTSTLSGTLTPQAKMEAAQVLILKLDRSTDHSPGMEALRQITQGHLFGGQAPKAQEDNRGTGTMQNGSATPRGRSEVQRSRNAVDF